MVEAILLGILFVPTWSETPAAQTPSTQGGYLFHANTREVLIDVTVTDNDGNPVQQLSRSAFHIFDNNRPEQLESFEEHTGTPATLARTSTAPNVFSNAYFVQPPASVNVMPARDHYDRHR